MEDKNKACRIGLMLVGVLLGLASILSVFIDEGGSDLMNFTLGAGMCFALGSFVSQTDEVHLALCVGFVGVGHGGLVCEIQC